MNNRNKTILVLLVIIMTINITLVSCKKEDSNEIIIASKNFTENIILSELLAQMIEKNTDITVIRKQNMGSTFVVYQAITSQQIDIYPDYTGTLYQAVLKQEDVLPAEETYEFVKKELLQKEELVIFPSFGFNNTYAIGLLEEKAEERNLRTISDLADHPDLIPGFDNEFVNRNDGGIAMINYYGLEFDNDIVQMEIGLKLFALVEGSVDFTDAFSTDSKLLRYNIRVLEDDKNFFPPYYAVPIVHQATLKKHPELEAIILKLQNQIDEDTMMQLNFQVEEDKLFVEQVASSFLELKGL